MEKSIYSLPIEIICITFDFLEFEQLLEQHIMLVCKLFNYAIDKIIGFTEEYKINNDYFVKRRCYLLGKYDFLDHVYSYYKTKKKINKQMQKIIKYEKRISNYYKDGFELELSNLYKKKYNYTSSNFFHEYLRSDFMNYKLQIEKYENLWELIVSFKLNNICSKLEDCIYTKEYGSSNYVDHLVKLHRIYKLFDLPYMYDNEIHNFVCYEFRRLAYKKDPLDDHYHISDIVKICAIFAKKKFEQESNFIKKIENVCLPIILLFKEIFKFFETIYLS